jgi:hypothetical protein
MPICLLGESAHSAHMKNQIHSKDANYSYAMMCEQCRENDHAVRTLKHDRVARYYCLDERETGSHVRKCTMTTAR